MGEGGTIPRAAWRQKNVWAVLRCSTAAVVHHAEKKKNSQPIFFVVGVALLSETWKGRWETAKVVGWLLLAMGAMVAHEGRGCVL